VERLRQLHPEIDLAYLLVQRFIQLLRTRTGEQLDAWLEAVASGSLADLRPIAASVSEDKEAIFAGLTKPESNGPTEGHITRLKLIKRSMYGRAQLDLLRLRVLSSSQKIQGAKVEADHKQWRKRIRRLSSDENLPNSQHSTFQVSEVA
jgi:transposase